MTLPARPITLLSSSSVGPCNTCLGDCVYLCEKITGEGFKVPSIDQPVNECFARSPRLCFVHICLSVPPAAHLLSPLLHSPPSLLFHQLQTLFLAPPLNRYVCLYETITGAEFKVP